MEPAKLPKVELHLHLDCSLSYNVVSKIAPEITLEDYRRDFIAPAKCRDLADYLTRAASGVALMQTREQLRLVVLDLAEQLKAENVIYAEIRFAPYLHTGRGLIPEQVVEIVAEAVEEAARNTGVELRLILCTLRHYSAEQSLHTVKLVEKFRGALVAAFDLAGDEAGFPLAPHVPAFQYAAEHGLPYTVHGGEARGPESVWEILNSFPVTRLGHGVRSVEDPQLLALLKERRIHLEVCPTCNVQTSIFETLAAHPVDRLYRQGLAVGINTDTRTITDVSLTQEYEKLRQVFGWDEAHFLNCNLNALQAAFIPEDLKERLAARLREGYTSLPSLTEA